MINLNLIDLTSFLSQVNVDTYVTEQLFAGQPERAMKHIITSVR